MKHFLFYTVCLCLSILQGTASTCSAARAHADKIAPKVTLDYPARSVTHFQPFRGTVSDSGGSGVAKVIVRITRIDERKRRWQWSGHEWWLGRPDIDFRQDNWWVEAKIKGTQWVYNYVPTRLVVLSDYALASGPDLHSGLYLIKVIAYDRANNSRALLRRVRVNADITAPRVIVESPRPGQKSHTFPVLKGRVSDRGGSGIESVRVIIHTAFPDIYQLKRTWVGDQWAEFSRSQPINDVLKAQVRGNRWWLSRPPTAKGLLPGRYAIIVYAYDRAGNRNGLKGVLKERMSWGDSKTIVEKTPEVTGTVRPIYITIQ